MEDDKLEIGDMTPLTVSGAENCLYLIPACESANATPTVIMSSNVGPGTPMPAWNNRWRGIGSVTRAADPDGVRDVVEKHADLLVTLSERYEGVEWDGNNWVGKWRDLEDDMELAPFHRDLEDVATYWEASDWYDCIGNADAAMEAFRECSEDIDAAAASEVELAAREGALLREGDVRKALVWYAEEWLEKHSDPEADEEGDARSRELAVAWRKQA